MSSRCFGCASEHGVQWRYNKNGDSRFNRAESGLILYSERSLGHNSENRTYKNLGTIYTGFDPVRLLQRHSEMVETTSKFSYIYNFFYFGSTPSKISKLFFVLSCVAATCVDTDIARKIKIEVFCS